MSRAGRWVSFIVLISLSLTTSIWSQKVDFAIDGKRIVQTIHHLASDQQLGRRTNTSEFFRLQDWAAQQFRGWRLEPAGDNDTYFQSVPIPREYTVSYGTPRLFIDGREFFVRFDDFSIDPRSVTGKTISGPIVFAGYGISAPEKGLDEYAGLDVRNKIVLVLKGDPGAYKPAQLRLSRRAPAASSEKLDLKVESTDSTKIKSAYAQGASAILFYAPDPEAPGRSPGFQRTRLQASTFARDFVIVTDIDKALFEYMLWTDPQMSQRAFETWLSDIRWDIQQKKVRSFVTGRKAAISGYDKSLFKGEKFNDATCRNVLAKMTGTDAQLKNQVIVIGAHFDHVGVTNGQIYNGAEDNASGSAVILELARLMHEHKIRGKRTILLALWTGEELGLYGSRHWAGNPTNGITLDSVVACFNMDMVGIGDSLGAPGALNFPQLWEIIKRDQDPGVIGIVKPRTGGPGGSDHAAFIERGIESLALMTDAPGGHPDYHDTGDDPQKMNPDILAKTCQFVLQGALNLANATDQPLLIADRQELFNGLSWPLVVNDPKEGVERGWNHVEAGSADELAQLLKKRIAEMRQTSESRGERAQSNRFGRLPIATGLNGAAVFDHNLHLLRLTKEILDIGRVDLDGSDSVWFNQGITEAGAASLKAMNREEIIVHIKNLSAATLSALPQSIDRPVLISNTMVEDPAVVKALKQKWVLVAVDFDPNQVAACVDRLITMKKRFGSSDHLLLNVTHKENLERGKQALYLELLKNGWSKKEIYAIGGAGETRRSSGNLEVLTGLRSPAVNEDEL